MGEQREPARRKVEAIALIAGELRLWRVAGTNDSFQLTPTIFGPKMDGGYGAGRAVQNAKLTDREGVGNGRSTCKILFRTHPAQANPRSAAGQPIEKRSDLWQLRFVVRGGRGVAAVAHGYEGDLDLLDD